MVGWDGCIDDDTVALDIFLTGSLFEWWNRAKWAHWGFLEWNGMVYLEGVGLGYGFWSLVDGQRGECRKCMSF